MALLPSGATQLLASTVTFDGVNRWTPDRPSTLVVACSDGRLQEVTDDFLWHEFAITRYDRFYVPGGGGALASSGRDYIRAQQMRRECRYLVELHQVKHIILLFHGPVTDGSLMTACADYRRKLPWASVRELQIRQADDARELIERREEWAGDAVVSAFRCAVHQDGNVEFSNFGVTVYAFKPPHERPRA